jgi:hypothetical protein
MSLKLVCSACLVLSLALACLWVRSFWVRDDVSYVTVDRATLELRDMGLGLSRGRVVFQDRSTIFDQLDGLDWGLEIRAMRGHVPGVSCVCKDPVDYSLLVSGGWFRRYFWFADLGRTYPADSLSRLHRDTGAVDSLGNCSDSESTIVFPIWEPLLVFLLPPLIAFVVYVRRRRRLQRALVSRRCVKCNYDLRASKGRCPECGTPF